MALMFPQVLYYPGGEQRVINFDMKSIMSVKNFNVSTKSTEIENTTSEQVLKNERKQSVLYQSNRR